MATKSFIVLVFIAVGSQWEILSIQNLTLSATFSAVTEKTSSNTT